MSTWREARRTTWKAARTGVKSTGGKIVLHESKVTSVMPKQRLTDQGIAARMLKLRDQGGPGLASSFGARRCLFLFLTFGTGLACLAATGMWSLFAVLLGMGLGVFLRDLGSLRATRRAWAFSNKVIDWKLVQELAGQASPAGTNRRTTTLARRILNAAGLAVVLLLLAVAIFLARPGYLWMTAWLNDKPARADLPPGFVDDASRLNQTHVSELWSIPADPSAAESQLKDLLQRARRDGLRVSIAGARHSMGGHTIFKDGIVLDMLPFRRMELDADKRILHVGAGGAGLKSSPISTPAAFQSPSCNRMTISASAARSASIATAGSTTISRSPPRSNHCGS